MRTLLTLLTLCGSLALLRAQDKDPADAERTKLAADSQKLNAEAEQLFNQGKYPDAAAKIEQALAMLRRVYPAATHPNGQKDIAETLGNLAYALDMQGAFAKAMPYHEEALVMARRLFPMSEHPDGHPVLADIVNSMGNALRARGAFEKALPYCEEALAMRRKLYPEAKYPDGHVDLATNLANVGRILKEKGAIEQSLPYFEQVLAMRRKLYPESKYPDGDRALAIALNDMGTVHLERAAFEKSLAHFEQAVAMYRRLYPVSKFPDGHPYLAIGLTNIGTLLTRMGAYDRAGAALEEALAMQRKLFPASRYPNGHRNLAFALLELGKLLAAQKPYERAIPFLEEAVAMQRKLYPESGFPNGHPEMTPSLRNLGVVYWKLGDYPRSLSYLEQVAALCDKLYPPARYPNGHPERAMALNSLAVVLGLSGAHEKARPMLEQVLAMNRALFPLANFPHGHPRLAVCLTNQGAHLHAMGESEKALPLYEEALTMRRNLFEQMLLTASEADALTFIRSQPGIPEGCLSVTRHVPDSDARAYRAVWYQKSALTRVLEHRLAAARAAGTEHAADLARLAANRRRIDQLLQDTRGKPAERDALLKALIGEQNDLERKLAAAIPPLKRLKERATLGPDDLVKALPANCAFVDFARYIYFKPDLEGKANKRVQQIVSYVAFVLVRPQSPSSQGGVHRVELGAVKPIDDAIEAWRETIARRDNDTGPAQALRDRVWQHIEKYLPAKTTTVYLSIDGPLARVPFSAIPGRGPGTVLLEEYALTTVPHGPFLLAQLQSAPEQKESASLLALGGVDYGKSSWQPLPGTTEELQTIRPLFAGSQMLLGKTDATAKLLVEALPKARYVHLATHGFFAEKELDIERNRERESLQSWHEGGEGARGLAARNPLGFTGLVLANGEVLSGLSLVDLPLENLRLVTLSACETGLGDVIRTEGVQGLQRAFHLAGCPNVVASLWNVNDASTAALMRRFYHHLWQEKQEPLQALRLAQLELYRNPAQIGELLRGAAPKFSGTTKPLPKGEEPKPGERAATKLWAAFVLSGVGK